MEIKELRQLTGLSQVNFGKRLNIPMRTIQDWEAGKRTPPEYVKELIEYRIKKELEEKNMENIVKVLYDGEEIGTVRTNQNITLDHALEMAGVDVNEMEDENTPKWDYDLFTLEY